MLDVKKAYSEGLAAEIIKDKWGFIDETEKWVIEPMFDDLWPFSEGLASVKING